MAFHPRPDEYGKPLRLLHPSQPTPLSTWEDAAAVATVVPDGPLPASIQGMALAPWADAPTTRAAAAHQQGRAVAALVHDGEEGAGGENPHGNLRRIRFQAP